MTVDRIGYGAGTKDFPDRPNVLRVVIGERSAVQEAGPSGRANLEAGPSGHANPEAGPSGPAIVKIECEIDDMSPQLFGPTLDRLLAAGALDAFLTPIQMKKNRPGTLLTVLAQPADRPALSEVIFRETTTIGLRYQSMERETLDRKTVDVAIAGGTVRIKIAFRHGEVVNAAPEFDDCARIAAATGQPVKVVQAAALRAWFARGEQGHA